MISGDGAARSREHGPVRVGVEVVPYMRLGRWLLGGILACGAVAIGLEAAGVHSPVRPALVLVFVILAPAVAIGGLLGGFDPLARAVLAVTSSLVVLTLTAMIMVAGGILEPDRRSLGRGDLHGRLSGRSVATDRTSAQRRRRLPPWARTGPPRLTDDLSSRCRPRSHPWKLIPDLGDPLRPVVSR